jgi:hypothetical protein
MKHLIRFNESVSNDPKVIKEYIAECFIDFLDEGSKVELFHYDEEYTVEIYIPKVNEELSVYSTTKEIEKVIEKNEKENEILNNALLCIEKVKIRYSNIYYHFENYPSSYELRFNV